MAWPAENDVEDREKTAVYFLQNYEDRWRSWVTPEAHRKIKDALEKAVSEGQWLKLERVHNIGVV
ncbi:MAG: hypothetical protein IID00_04490 [Chloroflexi bacterium]|nr:hypothetical protein [Chloroflexota bacterium]